MTIRGNDVTEESKMRDYLERLAYLCYFFFELEEESGGDGHSSVINLVNPTKGRLKLNQIRDLLLNELIRQQRCRITEAALAAAKQFSLLSEASQEFAFDTDLLKKICSRYEHPFCPINSADLKRERRFTRLARLLWLMFEHGVGQHSRAIQFFFPDSEVLKGKSPSAPQRGYHPEHVVPCAYIRDISFKHFKRHPLVNGHLESADSSSTLVGVLRRLLAVAYISKEEASQLDGENHLPYNSKSGMPDGWMPDTGDILIRLKDIGIDKLVPIEGT